MTVPAKYTLTEAHFRIVELEREAALAARSRGGIMSYNADIVRAVLTGRLGLDGRGCMQAMDALDALVAERDAWEVAAKKISGARNRWKKRADAAEAERDEARRLLTLMRKRKGDFELPNYWKGEIDAALGEDA